MQVCLSFQVHAEKRVLVELHAPDRPHICQACRVDPANCHKCKNRCQANFLGGYEVDRRRPGGIPLRFAVVEESLVVSGVAQEAHRELLGSRLVSVAGVPLDSLHRFIKSCRYDPNTNRDPLILIIFSSAFL